MKKKIILTTTIIVLVGIGIGLTLSHNKKSNKAMMEVINQGNVAVPVEVYKVKKQVLNSDFNVNGNFVAGQELKLLAENSGRINQIYVQIGDWVNKGQLLATIENTYFSIDLRTAKDVWQKLKTDEERYQSSFQAGGVTQAQLDDIRLQLHNATARMEQAQKRFDDAFIKAPIQGFINSRDIEIGSFISSNTSLFEIVDISNLKLRVKVSETQVQYLKVGSKADIRISALPEKQFTGVVSFIAVKADNSLNFPVEIKVNNSNNKEIKAGMYATVVFRFDKQDSKLVIPRNTFVGSVSNNEIFVFEDGKAKRREVTPGRIIDESVEILEGLTEGELVIIAGQINLVDDAKVEAIKN